MTWFEAAIIGFIILSIGYVVWRGGSANPEGTGTLGRKVSRLSSDVATLAQRVGHVEDEVAELKGAVATTADIARIEEKIATVRAEMSGDREVARRTSHSVDRIEQFLIEKSLGR